MDFMPEQRRSQKWGPKDSYHIKLSELPPENCSDRRMSGSANGIVPHYWPSQPQPLRAEAKIEYSLLAWDAFLCILPLCLFAKVVICIVANHKDKANAGIELYLTISMTKYLIAFNSWLSTFFMIVYILILTTCLRRLALWKAQRGAILGDLEQIQASISLPATLKAIWSLQHFTVRSCGLVAAWSFYYLGTVACRYEYRFENYAPPENLQVSYVNSSALSIFQKASPSFESPTELYDLQGQFYTYMTMNGNSISLYDFYRPTNDFTGAPYQPRIEQLQDTTTSHDGWWDITEDSRFQQVSQIGLQMTVPYNTNNVGGIWPLGFDVISGSFPINSTYIAVDCRDPQVLQSPTVNSKTESSASNSQNLTMEMVEETFGAGPTTPRAIRMSASIGGGQNLQYICALTLTAIEMLVSCDLQGCRPVIVRRTPGFTSSSPRTVFDDDQFASVFLTNLAQIAGDDIASNMYEGSDTYSVTRELMVDLNTLLTLSQQVDGINQNYTETLSTVGRLYYPRYVISWPWIGVDIVSCLILFLAALTSAWLRTQTLAPDIFGYVSSLTRDNPHINLPESGSSLSGLDRARLLKNLKIQILDVGTADQVGHVGVRLVDSELDGLRGLLRKEKFYL